MPPDDDAIREIVERAWEAAAARSPNRHRCWSFPFDRADVAASLSPAGWCHVGWIRDVRAELTYDIWWNVRTDRGRLRPTRAPRA